jgi:hypothetical protein
MHRAKIYLKQLNHDLFLKDLNEVKATINTKTDNNHNHTLLADIHELLAENLSTSKDNFEVEFRNAIELRERQVGAINLPNAITCCNFAKYLAFHRNFEDA